MVRLLFPHTPLIIFHPVKVVLEPYPSTTIHSVTTNVPSITAINTYSTAIETTVITGTTYVATVFNINVPAVTTIYSSVTQSAGVSQVETLSSTTSLVKLLLLLTFTIIN